MPDILFFVFFKERAVFYFINGYLSDYEDELGNETRNRSCTGHFDYLFTEISDPSESRRHGELCIQFSWFSPDKRPPGNACN